MPSLAGIPLVDPTSDGSGTAFELDSPAREDANAIIGRWTVVVARDTKIVLARGGADSDYDEAYASGLLHAQQGLDLLSIQGRGDLSIRGFDDDHLVWWEEPQGVVIRVVSIAPLAIDVPPVNIQVTDASGRPVPQTSPKPPEWHESFRYFRLSQTSDDLFDAYRNAYLALEAVLSSICPQKLQKGKVAESEGAWFNRALKEAAKLIDLRQMVPPQTLNPVHYLFDDLYVSMRSAMSHAKSGRRVLLPRTQPEREKVTDSLSRLVQLYLKLVEAHLGVRRLGGALFAAAFRRMFGATLTNMSIIVSEDASTFDSSDTVINPAGGRTATLTATSPLDTSRGFLATKLASAPCSDLADLRFIQRVGGVSASGDPVMAAVLEGPLVLGSATRLEVMLGVRGTNQRQPRSRYSF
ncbi:MAG: hypothetical protein ACRD1R_15480 [Acidobacteriota bacterium]